MWIIKKRHTHTNSLAELVKQKSLKCSYQHLHASGTIKIQSKRLKNVLYSVGAIKSVEYNAILIDFKLKYNYFDNGN